jgi:hypothetical protein
MNRFITVLLLTSSALLFPIYNIGDTVVISDNISWTITGPAGHSDVGLSDNIFNMINSQRKPVVIFFGQTW